MELQNQQELDSTRAKLRSLKEMYEEAREDERGNKEARQVELESLMGLINQLKEEIIRFECRHGLPRTSVRD